MEKVKKAGCIMINTINKTVAIVYRKKQNDYSFPKGHVEPGESLMECSIRETMEETKRNCILLENNPIYVEEYVTPKGEDVIMYYFLSKDIGPSDNDSLDTHDVYWISFDEVEDVLSYESLKRVWNNIKEKVKIYLNQNN